MFPMETFQWQQCFNDNLATLFVCLQNHIAIQRSALIFLNYHQIDHTCQLRPAIDGIYFSCSDRTGSNVFKLQVQVGLLAFYLFSYIAIYCWLLSLQSARQLRVHFYTSPRSCLCQYRYLAKLLLILKTNTKIKGKVFYPPLFKYCLKNLQKVEFVFLKPLFL